MAPSITLSRAGERTSAALTSSRRRHATRRSVATHATPNDIPSTALLTLSAGALLAQSGAVDPAAAAQLAPAAEHGTIYATRVATSTDNKFTSTSAPAVRYENGNITRTSSGPEANMADPDAYFDQVDKMEGRPAPLPAVRFVHVHGGYVQAYLPTPAVGDLADLNADVRGDATNYRDPAIAVPQDKVSDAISSSTDGLSTPDLSDAADAAKSNLDKATSKANKLFSALPTPAVGDLADLNADVRGAAKDYRDPAGAIQQDKFADKVKGSPTAGNLGDAAKSGLKQAQKKGSKMFSALPTPAVGDLADLNADVRGDATNYRDPAIAVPQDKVSDAISSSTDGLSTPDLSDAADAAKSNLDKATSKANKLFSALPTPAVGDLADLNADVRGAAKDYRDPAGAIQQDKFADKVKGSPTAGNLGDAAKSGLKQAQKKGSKMFSALPTPAVGDLADLNADVRNDATNYRDPAIAVPQDKVSGAISSSTDGISTPDLSDAADAAKSNLDKATSKANKLFSALPTPAVGDLADLNADVRGAAKDYRDPAGAIQQDKFADKVKGSPTAGNLGDAAKSGLKQAQKKGSKMFSSLPTPAVGDLADLNADVRNDATNYRDPAIAVPQDKVSDAISSSTDGLSTPDLSDAADAAKSNLDKATSKANKLFSALPTPAVGDLADLNADVRGAAKDYRDPAGAIQQDKFADKVKGSPTAGNLGDAAKSGLKQAQKKGSKMFSSLPTPAVGDLADLNADVRGDATNYRDPAIAVPQDKVSGAISSGTDGLSTPDLSDAADAAKSNLDKATSKANKLFSALPTPAVGDLADLNADVRGAAKDYRDPAGAIQQDKFADKVKGSPTAGNLGDAAKSGLKQAQKKGSKMFSSLPTPAVGDLADLNADVRGDATNYRDPAIAVPQDKVSGAISSGTDGLSTPDLSDAADAAKSNLDKATSKANKLFSALPTPAVGDLADLNADVRGAAKDYRDPAGAIQQDKFADKVKGSPTAGNLGDAAKSGLKQAQKKGSKMFSSLPTPAVGDLADLNADVRGDVTNYRDPAIAVPQDKVSDAISSSTDGLSTPDLTDAADAAKSNLDKATSKANKLFSALPTPAVGDLADLNADVRGAAKDYRDPAGAIQQDKFADKVKGSPTAGNLGDAAKSGLKQAQKKGSKMFSSLPTPAVGDLADLNADVRDDATNYRDPAIAVPQDKVSGTISSGTDGISTPDLSDAADAAKSNLDKATSKANKLFSALPTPAVGDLADLNADVRGAAKDYRDPAGAIQQDKFADKVKGSPTAGNLGDAAKSGLKQAQKKGSKMFSSLPTPAVGDLADLNADVRGDATNYRDPAGAIQQDSAAEAVKDKLPDLSARSATTPSAKKYGKKVVSKVTQTGRVIGVKAGYGPAGSRVRDSTGKLINADDVRGTNPPLGNARLSQPLVRDSLGAKRVSSKNQTGAAGGADKEGVVKPLKQVVDRVAN